MEENKDIQQESTGTGTGEKTEKRFSQEEVNQIVQERLAREKGKGDADLQKRTQELDKRERAVEELILTCAEAPSPFLSEIPEDMAVREKAVEEKQEEPVMAEQLSLFDFMWENAVLPIDKGDGLF